MGETDRNGLYLFNTYYSEDRKYGQKISIARTKKQKERKENRDIYKENIKAYEEFIQIVAKVVKEISLPKNTFSYSAVIGRLIKEGWLSRKNIFKPEEEANFLDIAGYYGMDVIAGEGCCRHASGTYTDVFESLKQYQDSFVCTTTKDPIPIKEGFKKEFDHVVNLFKYKNSYYIYDAFNQVFYIAKDGFRMIPYVKENDKMNPKYLFFKTDYDMVHSNKSLKEEEEKIKRIALDSKKHHISRKELKEILEETHNNFDKKMHLLCDLIPYTITYAEKIVPKHLGKK